ncbi:hypothetical protein FHS96_004941 [Sphingomonas zeicaulis]|uniref:hypothetical protein n=1 Tax=Sphingomonas zeicaulis TaxID=1632740 RepID=UPI003D1DCBA4
MAKLDIQYLTAKKTAAGPAYYWQPSPALRKAGWKPLALGRDIQQAIKVAIDRNRQVDAWRAGGAKPKTVAKHVEAKTVGALITAFEKAKFRPAGEGGLADNTQREYKSKLRTIEAWAEDGRTPLAAIDRKRVRVLRDALLTPIAEGPRKGEVRHHGAHATLRVLRTLLQFGVDEGWIAENPAINPGISTPPPRDQVWSPAARAAIEDIAGADGAPSLALTIALAPFFCQRQADMLHLSIGQYKEIPAYMMDADVAETLARMHDDGRIMGIEIRQRKGKRWIGVPIVGPLRDRMEAEIAKRKAEGKLQLFVDDRDGRAWTRSSGQTAFQRRFAEMRDAAIAAAKKAGDTALAAELDDLQFRDYRRTGVVMLGELGLADHLIAAITGHSLDETKKILEVYMPRTTGMAARAIALSTARAQPKTKEQANGQ